MKPEFENFIAEIDRLEARYDDSPHVFAFLVNRELLMSDLFWGDDDDLATARRLGVENPQPVPFEFIDKVFAVMALCPQHTFQILTKRPQRMMEYFSDPDRWRDILRRATTMGKLPGRVAARFAFKAADCLENVWLGVSVEDQKTADERIPLLLQTPAVIRWLSIEPLLGPVDLRKPIEQFYGTLETESFIPIYNPWQVKSTIDWVVAGGESGPDARPMHPDWLRSIRDQCTAAHVPFFFKQWGEYVSVSEVEGPGDHHHFPDGAAVRRVGKKNAGRTLDGRTWDEMPEASR